MKLFHINLLNNKDVHMLVFFLFVKTMRSYLLTLLTEIICVSRCNKASHHQILINNPSI